MFNTAVIFHEPMGKTVNMFWGLELVGPDTFGKGWLKLVGWNRKPNIGGLVVSRTKQGLDWFVFSMRKKKKKKLQLGRSGSARHPHVTCFFHRDPGAHTAVSGGNSFWNNSFCGSSWPAISGWLNPAAIRYGSWPWPRNVDDLCQDWYFRHVRFPERPLLVWTLLCWWRSHGFSNFNCHRVSPLELYSWLLRFVPHHLMVLTSTQLHKKV